MIDEYEKTLHAKSHRIVNWNEIEKKKKVA